MAGSGLSWAQGQPARGAGGCLTSSALSSPGLSWLETQPGVVRDLAQHLDPLGTSMASVCDAE